MMDPYAYNITVRRGEFEGESCFEARVKEFPDLIEYGDTFQEAYELALDSIVTTVAVLLEKGKTVPHPYDIPDDYSGRVTLRLPKTLHRALSESSEDQGVSLNQHLVQILAYFSGFAAGAMRMSCTSEWRALMDIAVPRKMTPSQHIKLVYSKKLDSGINWQQKIA